MLFRSGRLTGGREAVAELSAAELGRLAVAGTAETIPTLPDFLAAVAGAVPVVIEVKSRYDGDLRLATRAAAVAAAQARAGAADRRRGEDGVREPQRAVRIAGQPRLQPRQSAGQLAQEDAVEPAHRRAAAPGDDRAAPAGPGDRVKLAVDVDDAEAREIGG